MIANGWIEGLTVASIILGTVLGGLLLHGGVSAYLLGFDLPFIDTHIDTPPRITSYNVCYTKLLRVLNSGLVRVSMKGIRNSSLSRMEGTS